MTIPDDEDVDPAELTDPKEELPDMPMEILGPVKPLPPEVFSGSSRVVSCRSGKCTDSCWPDPPTPLLADDPPFFREYTGLSKLMVCRELWQVFLYKKAMTCATDLQHLVNSAV